MYKVCVGILVSLLLTSCFTTQVATTYSSPSYTNSFVAQPVSLQQNFEVPTAEVETEFVEIQLHETDLIEYKKHETIESVIEKAESFLGTRYRYGGTSKRGIDCSSFVQQSFKPSEIVLPRTSILQARYGTRIGRGELQKGDLVFFATRGGRRVSHVGIVHSVDEFGAVKFIHASSSQGVTITSLSNSYWSPRYLYAKRLFTKDYFESKELEEQHLEQIVENSNDLTTDSLNI